MPSRTGTTRRQGFRCLGKSGLILLTLLLALNEIIGHSLDSCTVNLTSYLRVMFLMDVIAFKWMWVHTYEREFRFIRDFSEEFDTSITLQMLYHHYTFVKVLFPCVMLVMLLLWPRSCSQPISGWYKGYYWSVFASSMLVAILVWLIQMDGYVPFGAALNI